MKKKKIIVLFLVVLIASIYVEKLQVSPMEDLNIIAGIGFDINKELDGNVQYSIPFSIYDFKKKGKGGVKITNKKAKAGETSEQSSSIIKPKANSIGETREERQLKSSKPFTIGTEKML